MKKGFYWVKMDESWYVGYYNGKYFLPGGFGDDGDGFEISDCDEIGPEIPEPKK